MIYDLLLQGGHVVDPANGINGVRDIAIKDGRKTAKAGRPAIAPQQAAETPAEATARSRAG